MGIMSKISGHIYKTMIEPYSEIKKTYNAYAQANYEYHYKHRIRSYFYLKRLHKAFKNKKDLSLVRLPKGALAFKIVNVQPNRFGHFSDNRIPANNKINQQGTAPKKSNQQTTRKLPYLSGAESEFLNRPSPLILVQQLLKYDVISFDVFDTLLFRPFDDPTTLFLLLAQKYKIMDFRNIRIDAEREARQQSQALNRTTEISIYDIYKVIHSKTGLDVEIGVNTEIETEMEMCFANPYMKRVFNVLKEYGKCVIAVSDMYLPKEVIRKLLEKNGFDGFSDIYVSCEYFVNKREKGLYAQIKSDYGKNKKYVHVGDNPISDDLSARGSGFDAVLYKNVNTVGNLFRAEGMSKLTGSIYNGLVNSELHNGINRFTPHYEYGFIYGGVYVLGYCNWIHEYCLRNGVKKILFLSRDGAIYKKVFNLLFNDVENEYVYWSRIANTKCIVSLDKYDFLTRMVHHKAIAPDKVTIHSLLRSINLLDLEKYLESFKLNSKMLLTTANEKLVERFFDENWEKVLDLYSETEQELKSEIVRVINGYDRVAIVDVGWIGSGPYGLKRLIETKWALPCKVDAMVAACKYYHPDATTLLLQNNDLNVYMFSIMNNRINYDRHAGTNKGLNNIFFELFTQDTTPSFSGIDKTEYTFDYPEVENYHYISEIQQGIFDFCCVFNKHFNNYKVAYNISGYDAYLPFRMIIKDLKFIKRYFGEFSYARGVACDIDNQKVDTIASLIEGTK